MVTKEQVWKGLRLELTRNEMQQIYQAGEYELDDYYNYDLLVKTLKMAINKEIDFGVMAIKNIVAGNVVETKEALTPKIELFDTLDLPIHHCLFKKSPQSNIEYVASHIQALHQTQETRKKILKNVIEIECTDTALAAKMLFNGEYPENYAVICRENAGNFFNLTLVEKNIEDNPFNTTTFGLFKLKIR